MPTSISSATAGPLAAMGVNELVAAMRDFRARTLALVDDLNDEQLIGPRLAIVNPPLWEIGHIAWFAEFWVLRHLNQQKPLLPNGDELYNSTDVAHDTRWELLLPARDKTLAYVEEVMDRSIEQIDGRRGLSAEEFYFYLLATFHEGMHAEALAYTRQTLGYAAPSFTRPTANEYDSGAAIAGDAAIPGGKYLIGATQDFPFVFDNEKWAHSIEVKPFRIARAPVTNGEFLAFVEDGGYRAPRFWSEPGWRWLESGGAPQLESSFAKFFNRRMNEAPEAQVFSQPLHHPVYWKREANGRWIQRIYDHYFPLNENLPVVHVSWYEAEAYCTWADRRLPTEAEWEIAASIEPAGGDGERKRRRHFPWGDEDPTPARANLDWQDLGPVAVAACAPGDSAFGCRQMLGNVWEWTADDFKAYPGFSADPYKEYSMPWFGTHKVLRGGCWATSSLLIRNTWRNFYTPDRRDVWAGFRTCAK
jgi:gamma-glutamyl hercynylcysteine S-oxide synthase